MTTPNSDVTTTSSTTGLAPNVAGALAYVLGPITGIAFLVLEKENRFVRFHAAQSIVVSVIMIAASIALSILSAILAIVPVLGWLLGLLLSVGLALLSFILWLVLMYKAFNGEEYELPFAGDLARKLLNSAATNNNPPQP